MPEADSPGDKPALEPRITITLLPNGNVNVETPIDNRILVFGLLKMAERALDQAYRSHDDLAAYNRARGGWKMPHPPGGREG